MTGLVRAFRGYAKTVGLRLRGFGQPDADLRQVKAADFLIQLLGQTVGRLFVVLAGRTGRVRLTLATKEVPSPRALAYSSHRHEKRGCQSG